MVPLPFDPMVVCPGKETSTVYSAYSETSAVQMRRVWSDVTELN